MNHDLHGRLLELHKFEIDDMTKIVVLLSSYIASCLGPMDGAVWSKRRIAIP